MNVLPADGLSEPPVPSKEQVQRTIDYYGRLLPRPGDDDQGIGYGDIAAGLREEIDWFAPARAATMAAWSALWYEDRADGVTD